jgi:hypothetical protein
MIDLTNKPEGATHYGVSDREPSIICWYNIKVGSYKYLYSDDIDGDNWSDGTNGAPLHTLIPVEPDWTIHNNTLPLSELSDEQAAELFNYCRNGGAVESKTTIGWANSSAWVNSRIYQAKQKTDRELFIDLAMELSGTNLEDISLESLGIIDEMFTDGFKAPKDGE